MINVKILGAGSIGNHLTHACRSFGWNVDVFDIDRKALKRMKNIIYPKRYSRWDNNINLLEVKNAPARKKYDLSIIGTPPTTHIDLALKELEETRPKVLLIEKPLCDPSLKNCKKLWEISKKSHTKILVGYNHNLTAQSIEAKRLLKTNFLGEVTSISSYIKEHWQGILLAHPWLDNLKNSYLGHWQQGGGATGEHSHGIAAWLMFAEFLNIGKVTEVNATMNIIKTSELHYDQTSFIRLRTEKEISGNVIQDVVTKPPNKHLRIQGSKGFLEWHINIDPLNDGLKYGKNNGEIFEKKFTKTRFDDFQYEIKHIENLLKGIDDIKDSPISLQKGLEAMQIIAAAYQSNEKKKTIKIDYLK